MSSLTVHRLKWQKVWDKSQWSDMSALEREPKSERCESAINHKGTATAIIAFTMLWHYLAFIYMGEKGLQVVRGIKIEETPQPSPYI